MGSGIDSYVRFLPPFLRRNGKTEMGTKHDEQKAADECGFERHFGGSRAGGAGARGDLLGEP